MRVFILRKSTSWRNFRLALRYASFELACSLKVRVLMMPHFCSRAISTKTSALRLNGERRH